VFSHSWLFRFLFAQTFGIPHRVGTVPSELPIWPQYLVYIVTESLFQTNVRALQQKIEYISFNDLRKPSILGETNDLLHDCRQDLALLRAGLLETGKYLPTEVVDWFEEWAKIEGVQKSSHRGINESLSQILDGIDKLSSFLMDSFQLLISTVSTLDAKHSFEEGKRSTLLTQLAFIYIPLSFVTGIFGMNVKEINSSPLSLWVAVVSLVIIVIITAGIFYGLRVHEDQKNKPKTTKVLAKRMY
jgi:Mg2+ and Co2+ transporter CorA